MPQEKLLLIPGPSPVVPRILDALALPTVSHVGPDMAHDLKESCENLKRIVFSAEGEPFIVAGAGTLSMEMALLNTAGPADRVLVLSQGYFGDRMAQICRAFGIDHDVLECEWGRAVTPRELDRRLKTRNYNIVVCTHVDTATGACAPVEEYSQVLEKTGAIFIVDGVCATGGIAERMDAWGIDVVLTAAQKCLGTPPGLAILVLSEPAMEKRRGLASVPAYYSDILRWLPIMHDPTKYFSTPCVNEIRAFAEATAHRPRGGDRRAVRAARPLCRGPPGGTGSPRLLASSPTRASRPRRSPSCSYPDGVEDKAFRAGLAANGVIVAGGLGPTAGRVFRMGHMGNLTSVQVRFAIEAVERTLAGLGRAVKPGAGRDAVDGILAA